MANIFASLQVYAGKWNVKSSRAFTAEEISVVESAVVVPSNYGNSVCFFMRSGGQTYIPLSSDSTKGVGEVINLTEAQVLTLEKSGENDIIRVKA